MTGPWSWIEERVPAPVLMAGPGTVGVALLVVYDATLVQVAVGVTTAALSGLTAVALLLASGWVRSRQDLATTTVAGLRRRRRSLVQHAAFQQRLVEELRGSSDRASSTTGRLLTELVRAEEGTRATLAAELHDTVAQSLGAALMALSGLRDPKHLEGLESVRDAEEQLRAVLARIRPPELARGSLAEAVADLRSDLQHRYGVGVDVSWTASNLPLPSAVATLVYRFMQATLLNAVEHADGQGLRLVLDVLLEEGGPALTVAVSDDGPGFDPAAVVSVGGRHVGLKLAVERARLVGGDVHISSGLGTGTTVTLHLPLSWAGGLRIPESTPSPVQAVAAPNGANGAALKGTPRRDETRAQEPLAGGVRTG